MSACPSLKFEEPSKMPTSHSANEATTKAVSLLPEQNANILSFSLITQIGKIGEACIPTENPAKNDLTLEVIDSCPIITKSC